MRHPFATLALGMTLGTGCVSVRRPDQSPLVGQWELSTFVIPDSGGNAHPWWDDKPAGFIVYTADGFVSAQLYDTRRAVIGVRWDSASADVSRAQYAGLTSYYGTYVLDTVAHTVTHTVAGAMAPDWVGRKLVRGYRFISPNEVELRVITDANGRPTSMGPVLVWRRVDSTRAASPRSASPNER